MASVPESKTDVKRSKIKFSAEGHQCKFCHRALQISMMSTSSMLRTCKTYCQFFADVAVSTSNSPLSDVFLFAEKLHTSVGKFKRTVRSYWYISYICDSNRIFGVNDPTINGFIPDVPENGQKCIATRVAGTLGFLFILAHKFPNNCQINTEKYRFKRSISMAEGTQQRWERFPPF